MEWEHVRACCEQGGRGLNRHFAGERSAVIFAHIYYTDKQVSVNTLLPRFTGYNRLKSPNITRHEETNGLNSVTRAQRTKEKDWGLCGPKQARTRLLLPNKHFGLCQVRCPASSEHVRSELWILYCRVPDNWFKVLRLVVFTLVFLLLYLI